MTGLGPGAGRPRACSICELVFVTGKGGVGKTTVAAALAQLAAERGKRVLACEVDAKGDLAALFEAAPTGFAGREVAPGDRWPCRWTPRRRCAST